MSMFFLYIDDWSIPNEPILHCSFEPNPRLPRHLLKDHSCKSYISHHWIKQFWHLDRIILGNICSQLRDLQCKILWGVLLPHRLLLSIRYSNLHRQLLSLFWYRKCILVCRFWCGEECIELEALFSNLYLHCMRCILGKTFYLPSCYLR